MRRWPAILDNRARFTAAVLRACGVKVIPNVAAPISRRQRRSTPAFPKNFAAMGLANDRGRKDALLSRAGEA
jgi:hypothetical protein